MKPLLFASYTFTKSTSSTTGAAAMVASHHKGYYSHELRFKSEDERDSWATAIAMVADALCDGPFAVDARIAEMKLMREVSELREKVLAEGKSVPALSTTASLVRPIATVSSHGMKLESYEGK